MYTKILMSWWRTWRTVPVFSWLKAANLYKNGQYIEAQHFYLKGLKSHSNHPAAISARLDLAYCYFKERRVEDAEEQLETILSLDPAHRDAAVRLTRVNLWCGRNVAAAHIARQALKHHSRDAELSALFLIAALDHGSPEHLLQEACVIAERIGKTDERTELLEVALAKYAEIRGERLEAYETLRQLATQPKALFESVLSFSELLVSRKNVLEAIYHLRRTLAVSSDHPRVLSLLAEAYLIDSELQSPNYAMQLATSACQSSKWRSARELAVLAEAYRRSGDKVGAFITASRAKELGKSTIGIVSGSVNLDDLIAAVSSGTIA